MYTRIKNQTPLWLPRCSDMRVLQPSGTLGYFGAFFHYFLSFLWYASFCQKSAHITHTISIKALIFLKYLIFITVIIQYTFSWTTCFIPDLLNLFLRHSVFIFFQIRCKTYYIIRCALEKDRTTNLKLNFDIFAGFSGLAAFALQYSELHL